MSDYHFHTMTLGFVSSLSRYLLKKLDLAVPSSD